MKVLVPELTGSNQTWIHGHSISPCGLELRLGAVLKMALVGYEGYEHLSPGLLQVITASIISASSQGVRIGPSASPVQAKITSNI